MKAALPFGRYLLLDRINVGGMAEVYLAKAFGVEGFERLLAIKRILPNMAEDEEFIGMFVDEARLAVQLSHANIVQVYELGKFENQYYIAMEYVSCKDLRQLLDVFRKRGETLPIPAAAFIATKICEGLDYAHRKADPSGKPLNLIHRDVSPQNILIGFEGAVKVTDFGIAKAEDRASKTQAGVLKGKFGYMSPEQVRGLEIDQRSDLFAVGILLYEMVTGKRLFVGESDFSTLEKVRAAEVIPPTQHNPGIPEALERVMLKALARERDERYAWASDLADDLQPFLIEDGTVFNAKRLANLLKGKFPEELEKERSRIEEAMRVVPSPEFSARLAGEMQEGSVARGPDIRGEKTMVFESAGGAGRDFTTAPTQIAVEPSKRPTANSKVEVPTGVSKPGDGPRSTGVSRAGMSGVGRPSQSQVGLSADHRRLGLLMVLGALLLTGALIAIVRGLSPSAQGTLVINSMPPEVDLFLDGAKIASRTPVTRSDIPVGRHSLLARAAGFIDKEYRFELLAGDPAVIDITLEPIAPPAAATLEILSEPSQAKVRVGGLPQGETPLSLPVPDVSKPFIFEISKPDYNTETKTVTFAAGETTKSITVTLTPTSGAERTKLLLRSTPDGAEIYMGETLLCVTPCEGPSQEKTAVLELRASKQGFKDDIKKVPMAGRREAQVLFKLKPQKKPVAGGCSGSGAKVGVSASPGVPDCKVTLGSASLGVAPFMPKDAPVGRCDLKVTCADGKRFSKSLTLKAGSTEKIVIYADMWQ